MTQPAEEELMLEWMNPLLTVEEMDRLVGWHLGVSLRQALRVVLFCAGVSEASHMRGHSIPVVGGLASQP